MGGSESKRDSDGEKNREREGDCQQRLAAPLHRRRDRQTFRDGARARDRVVASLTKDAKVAKADVNCVSR